MQTLKEVHKEISACAGANNWTKAIEDHGYTFTYIKATGRTCIFFATQKGQIIIDFEDRLLYICHRYKIISMAEAIEDDVYQYILQNFNQDPAYKDVKQKERIENIVNFVFSLR